MTIKPLFDKVVIKAIETDEKPQAVLFSRARQRKTATCKSFGSRPRRYDRRSRRDYASQGRRYGSL